MSKFNFCAGGPHKAKALIWLGGVCVALLWTMEGRAQGTKTPYTASSARNTPPPAGFQPVFVNYVGRHGARFMTKAGADIEALQLLQTAENKQGLTALGVKVMKMVKQLCDIEKGQYESITLLGAKEQEGIGQRLLRRNKPAFTGKGVDVVVTYKVRTQQSADAFLKAFGGYTGQRHFFKQPDSLDAVLRFYDLSPAYQQYKKGKANKLAIDSLDRDRRNTDAVAAVCERVFTPAYRSALKLEEELQFAANLYDLYSVQFSLPLEIAKKGWPAGSVDLGIAFQKEQLDWEDFVGGASDFLEKGPARDSLGIQVKVAAPLLADFVRTTDEATGRSGSAGKDEAKEGTGGRQQPTGRGRDAVLRFTHAEAISPFATLLGIPEASVPASRIFNYREHWQAEKIIPLSANVQWIVYSNGKEYLVRILLNEREILLPLRGVGGEGATAQGGPYYRWEDLRAWCLGRLKVVGAGLQGDMLKYLQELR